jgi:hypothetical protein
MWASMPRLFDDRGPRVWRWAPACPSCARFAPARAVCLLLDDDSAG